MEYSSIRFDITGDVARITLNRPDKLNAITPQMADEVIDALGRSTNARARAVLLTGEGRAFCSGADLSQIDMVRAPGEGARRALDDHYNPMMVTLAELAIPVVCAVNGPAVGFGCSLAMAADLCLMAESGYYQVSFVNIGLVPDGGASWMLPHLIGKARAAEMMMLGERVLAEKAVAWGMAMRVVGDDVLAAEGLALAARLARGPTRALGLMRRNIHWGLTLDFDESLAMEAEAQRRAAESEDAAEGIAAFLQKRPPQFKGR